MNHEPKQEIRPLPTGPLRDDDVSALHDLICAAAGALLLAAAAMGFLSGCTTGAPIAAAENGGAIASGPERSR